VTGNGRANLYPAVLFAQSQVGFNPLVSKFHSSVSPPFLPHFDLFAKEAEAQRAGRLINVYILAVKLIALHKQLVS
jgi:hypothetical protein